MKKCLGTVSSLFFAANVWAGDEINHLDVNDGIVVFGTSETKTSASPSCMATDQADKWAISINSESGRAIYSLLMTAMVTNRTVTVVSAGDCADAEGYERAIGVNLDVNVTAVPTTVEMKTFYKPVAYGINGYANRKYFCNVTSTLKDDDGTPYLHKVSTTTCECQADSKLVFVGARNRDENGYTYEKYFNCVIESDFSAGS